MRIEIVNGPNLNLVGKRSPEIYGRVSMEQVMLSLQKQWLEVRFRYFQSNHEGAIIDELQALALAEDKVDGIVLNAGGYTHTSVAIRDAVEFCMECGIKVVELHISDISKREPFRQKSLLTDVCADTIIGKGTEGYKLATQWLIDNVKS
ncbi:MAG: 3-dehydroquinate dehydratase [Paludibacteraceae bacterium]|nr:3-dehydroquinate dehydratase [Paludibacteraceae bacterium]